MKRHVILSLGIASLAVLGGLTSQAHAALDATNHSQWDEDYYYNGFGGAAPAGAVEYSVGFSTIADLDGRVISNAAVTTNNVDSSPLTTISTDLFSGTDANLYEIAITNPATFSASLPGSSNTNVLALFSSNGTALAAAIGGAADPITAAAAGVTTPGIYYVGIADPGGYPENNEGQNIFGLTGAAGVFTPAAGVTDLLLSTTPSIAWTINSGLPGLLTNTSFTAPSSTISLTGSDFAVVPEPASASLLIVGGLGLLCAAEKLAVKFSSVFVQLIAGRGLNNWRPAMFSILESLFRDLAD